MLDLEGVFYMVFMVIEAQLGLWLRSGIVARGFFPGSQLVAYPRMM